MTEPAGDRPGVLRRARRSLRRRSDRHVEPATVREPGADPPVRSLDVELNLELNGEAFAVEVAPELRLGGTLVRAAGAGTDAPTVVFCHCWTGRRELWHATAALLVDRGLDVVVLDHRGHGASPLGDDPILIETLSADLDLVLGELGLARVLLVGHSEGGAIASHRTSTGDERVVGLVIVASAAKFVSGRLRPARGAARRVMGSRALERVMGSRVGRVMIRPTLGRRPSAAAVDATIDAYRATPRESVAAHLDAVVQFDLTDRLEEIRVPTVVAVGGRDLLTPARRARRIVDGVPGATMVRWNGAGHMLPLERPNEVADLIVTLVDDLA